MQSSQSLNKKQGFAAYLRKCFIVAVSVILAVSMMPVGGIEAIAAPSDQIQAGQTASNSSSNSSSTDQSLAGSSEGGKLSQPAQSGNQGAQGNQDRENQSNSGDGLATTNNSGDSSNNSPNALGNNAIDDSSGQTAAALDDETAIMPLSIPQGELNAAIANNTVEGLDPVGATVNLFDYTVMSVDGSDTYQYTVGNWNNMITSGINANHALLFGNLTSGGVDGVDNAAGGRWNQGGSSPT